MAKTQMKKGVHERWVTMLTADLPDEALDVLAQAKAVGPKKSVIMIQRLGGQIDRCNDGCYAHRGAGFWIVLQVVTSKIGSPEDMTLAQNAEKWLNDTTQDLKPLIVKEGTLGCVSPIAAPNSTMPNALNVFGSNTQRLKEIKTVYDPNNTFAAVENGISGAHNI